MHVQNTTHRIENHLQHGFWTQTCSDDVCDSLYTTYKFIQCSQDHSGLRTFPAVILEICALRPDCLSGAVSKQIDIRLVLNRKILCTYSLRTQVFVPTFLGDEGVLEDEVGLDVDGLHKFTNAQFNLTQVAYYVSFDPKFGTITSLRSRRSVYMLSLGRPPRVILPSSTSSRDYEYPYC